MRVLFSGFPLLFFISVLTGSCDKVEGPYGEKILIGGDSGTVKRKILLEDFTGHTCGNCPEAAAAVEQLYALYGKQIVPIGVHVGFFADPAGSKYSANYKTTEGNDLATYYGVGDVLPKGMVSRKDFEGKKVLDYQDWNAKVASLISQQAQLSIELNPVYSTGSGKIDLELNFKFVQPVNEELKYIVYILEDSLNSPQKNYGIPEGELLNYYHRHVLRASMNGSWGEALSAGEAYEAGQEITHSKSYTIPNAWNHKQVSLVAFVYKASDREVLQAETVKIWEP